jgi:hypothetical protein
VSSKSISHVSFIIANEKQSDCERNMLGLEEPPETGPEVSATIIPQRPPGN